LSSGRKYGFGKKNVYIIFYHFLIFCFCKIFKLFIWL
jgi:hypothetical protein